MAYNDYCYAKAGMKVGEQLGNYNGVAALCAQSAEKYLKAILEVTFAEDALGLMHSHNLRAITNKLIVTKHHSQGIQLPGCVPAFEVLWMHLHKQ